MTKKTYQSKPSNSPPVIVVGGETNALAIARRLHQRGVKVYALNRGNSLVNQSRTSHTIRFAGSSDGADAWERFLLGPDSDFLRGAVLLTCNDEAIEILIKNSDALAEKFIVEETPVDVRQCFLDKLLTYQAAREAGVATPNYWSIETEADVEEIAKKALFPIILKPLYSHHFRKVYGNTKYLRAEDTNDLRRLYEEISAHSIEVVAMEFVPGGDDLSCSYCTYMDENGQTLFEFTKRVVRRHPPNMGGECCGETDWNPEVREVGLRFYRHVGLRGLATTEFKRDPRDGQLKIIECNGRFTAPVPLFQACGLDVAGFVYDRLTGRDAGPLPPYRLGVRWWRPKEDFLAFWMLRRQGKITVISWLREILRPQALAVFRWSDPLPSIALLVLGVKRVFARLG